MMLCPDCKAPLTYDMAWEAVMCWCLVNRDGFTAVRRMWFTDEQAATGNN